MNISVEYAWAGNGRDPVLIVYENGARVASFDEEAEAWQWIADEYAIDPDTVEIES